MSNMYPKRNPSPGPSGSPAPRSPRPRPANDNRPPVKPPRPANDNLPRGFRPPVRPPYRWLGKALARAIPGVGWFLTAWDLYELWKQLNPDARPGSPFSVAGYRRVDAEECWLDPPQTWQNYEKFAAVTGLCGGNFNAGAFLPDDATFETFHVYEWWRIEPEMFGRMFSRRHQWERIAGWEGPGYVIPPSPWFIPDMEPYIPFIEPLPRPRPDQPVIPLDKPVRRRWERKNPKPLPEEPLTSYRDPREEPYVRPRARPKPRRPDPWVKERKVRMKISQVRRLMGWLLSNYSEAMDLMESFYDALPDKLKLSGDPTQAEMMKHLYKHMDSVDPAEAISNWLQNDREDKIFGHGFEVLTEVFEAYGIELPTLRL